VKKGAVVLLLGAVLTAGAALAGDAPKTTAASSAKPAAAKPEMAKGTITAIDAAKKTITVKGASTWTFETGSTTAFVANKKAGAWGDLKVGEKVVVQFQSKGAEHVATKIVVEG
jgi:Cu/Ag efflux protein CusF